MEFTPPPSPPRRPAPPSSGTTSSSSCPWPRSCRRPSSRVSTTPPAFIFALGAFAVGFAFRPIGALIFGRIGDRIGRKATFLATMSLMGLSTFAIGLLPSYASAGIAGADPVHHLRILQGLALGGEWGGAAIYIVEHVARRQARPDLRLARRPRRPSASAPPC
jgi:MFS family permease